MLQVKSNLPHIATDLPPTSLPGGPPARRQKVDRPGGKLARELLWDVSRGEP